MEWLNNLLFPKMCLGCGKWGSYLCPDCLNFIQVLKQRKCPVCARLSPFGLTHPGCKKARSLDGLTAIFTYQGIVKKAITKLKYRFVTDLSSTILELFLSYCGEDKAFTKFVTQEKVFLIPIPLYWQRKNWRGFNQAELLGKMIAQKLGIGFIPDLLVRVKNTQPQSLLDKKDRGFNIRDAFRINKHYLNILNSKTLNILLFDDVWTTGATLKEAAKILKTKGIGKVWGLTLAA